jgi:ABC-2 type transport system permease protein
MTPPSATTAPLQRALSPDGVRSGGVLHTFAHQVKAEVLKLWRIPAFSLPTILFPALLFLLFAAPAARNNAEAGEFIGQYLLATFSAYGLLGVSFFSIGVGVAAERGQGWGILVRATPLPPWIYFTAKLVMTVIFASLILALMFAAGYIAAGVRMPLLQWGWLFLVLVLGVLPLTTIGFTLGYWAGPNSAAPLANIIFLPLSFASGLWQPLDSLPDIVQQIAPYLPTYHYGRVALYAVGVDDGQIVTHVLWLVGTAVLFTALAVWGYRRDEGRLYG